MENNNKQLTPEQLKLLQQMLAGGAGGTKNINQTRGQAQSLLEKMQKITAKSVFSSIILFMQNNVKLIDQCINLVVKEDGGNANDVVKSAKSPILFGMFVIIFFVLIGTLWAATAPLDSAAVAIGTVVSQSQKKLLNHQEGGIVKEFFVKVGDSVRQGDKLIELDDTKIKSEYENVLNQYRTYLATEHRLLAEINNEDEVTYPLFLTQDKADPKVKKLLETQNSLFNSKKTFINAEKDSLKQKRKQIQKQIEGYEAKKIASQKLLEVTRDRLSAARRLSTKGYVQKATLLDLEAKEANALSDIAVMDTEIARSEQEMTKVDIDLLNIDSKHSTSALNELKETQVNLASHKARYIHLQDALSRVIIRSPVDGVINNIHFHTVGSTIAPNQTIIEISPDNDRLVIDAKIEPKTIDSIRVGLVSKIRFSAFKSRTTPLFTGKVISLSPDLIQDNQRGPGDPLANGYYLARIELDMDNFNEIAKTRKLELHPGMQAEVQIVTGTRTLLKYLLDPVYDAMFKGFKEK